MIECDKCGENDSKVLSTYRTEKGHYERLRKCHQCGKIFTTREYSALNLRRLIDDKFKQLVKDLGGR